jgi:2-dehydro-3-deoxygalactonokinase
MRGEETQVVGALQRDAAWSQAACLLMPGTHSKWVQVRGGRIESLATYMTGELFGLLRTHSILGRLMPADAAPSDDAAPSPGFLRGVEQARHGQGELLHTLFSARTLALTQQLPREQIADYLSGLLIGSELAAALALAPPDVPLLLVGEPALCRRYGLALHALHRGAAATLGNTAPDGLWALARAAGLSDP